MPTVDETRLYRFGDFQLHEAPISLHRRGTTLPVRYQCLDLLHLLVRRAGRAVTREEIRHHLWNGQDDVDHEAAINTTVSTLRQALGDDSAHPRYIETLPRSGYRFVAPVKVEVSPPGWRRRLRRALSSLRLGPGR